MIDEIILFLKIKITYFIEKFLFGSGTLFIKINVPVLNILKAPVPEPVLLGSVPVSDLHTIWRYT